MEASAPEEVDFGKSIIVPSVQELAKQPLVNIPPRYARFDHDPCPPISSADGSLRSSIPIIYHERLNAQESGDLDLQRLHSACKDWGFFQIVNHGVSPTLLEGFKLEVENFFKLRYEDKKKLWQQPDNNEGFWQNFVVSDEQKLGWSDLFKITTLPLNVRKHDLLNNLPPKLRENLEAHCTEVKKLAISISGHMAKALKMDEEEMNELFNGGFQTMRMNSYPPCPEPEKAIGLARHSDATALTILFQLNETEGLQIRKEGRWVSIKPLPNALVVNIGDIMEIFSNGIYKSIEHRAIVNSTKERLSVATFHAPKLQSIVGPTASLIALIIHQSFGKNH